MGLDKLHQQLAYRRLTHQPVEHQPTDLIIEKYSTYSEKILLGKCKTIFRSIIYLMIILTFKKKLLFHKRHTEELIVFIF